MSGAATTGSALVPAAAARGVLHSLVDGAGILLANGRPSAARDAAAAVLAAADRCGDASAGAYAAAILGHALMQLDDADGAADAAAQMLARLGPESDPLWRARALALQAAADVERHRQLAGLDALAEALAIVEQGAPGSPLHAAASSSVASLLMRLSMYEASAELLSAVARSPASPVHRLLAVRALLALNVMWSAQLELLGHRRDADERLVATASCALRMGRMARAAGLTRLARAASAVEAYALERLGLPELGAARARAALADEPEPGWVFEWLPGRAALAAAAWWDGDLPEVRYWVDQLEKDSPVAGAGMGRTLWQGLVQQALARISGPAPGGDDCPVHPAVGHLQEITRAGARMLWREREARAGDVRQRILRFELARRGEQTARDLLVDALTGLGNRRRLEEELSGGGHRVALFVDVDHFKGVNDTHGHEAGDEVLRRVARILAGCCRDEDVVVRYGGDEFVVLPAPPEDPAVDVLAGARRLAERLLGRVRSEDWSSVVGSLPITVSVGVAGGAGASAALHDADAAMLAAKRAGRDTLVEL